MLKAVLNEKTGEYEVGRGVKYERIRRITGRRIR